MSASSGMNSFRKLRSDGKHQMLNVVFRLQKCRVRLPRCTKKNGRRWEQVERGNLAVQEICYHSEIGQWCQNESKRVGKIKMLS